MSFPGFGVRFARGTVTLFAPYLTTNTCSSTCVTALHEIPAWNPCLLYQPWSKCLANTMESPTHPCNTSQALHRFQFWRTKFTSPQFSFSILSISEAFPFQLGMIWTATPQCTFTLAVFWQATSKERWISLLLCQRSHCEKTKHNL